MAISTFKEASELTYKLYFHQNLESPDKSVPELTLIQRGTTSLKYNDQSFDIDLNDIDFQRKVYQPGCITVNLQISYQSALGMRMPAALSQDDLKTIFLQRRITLGIAPKEAQGSEQDSEIIIAENYYVHEIIPQVVRDSKKSMLFVKLCIYSMDKLMTLNPYSKAYVVKRLGADILKHENRIFGFKGQLVNVYTDNLQNLTYEHSGEQAEFIQPYLVQYNESFYDFMARTSNRCGEFLMFEDGQLILGMPKSEAVIHIDQYASVSYQNISSTPLDIKPFVRDSVKDEKETKFNDTPSDKDSTGYPKGTFGTDYTYNAELSHDDYIFPMVKDKFSNYWRALGMYSAQSAAKKISLDLFSKLVSNTSDPKEGAISIAKDFGIGYGMQLCNARSGAQSANSNGNNAWIEAYKDRPQQTDGTRTVPFATASEEGWVKLAYYSRIRSEEEAQQKKIIRIDLGTSFVPVKLGSKVTVQDIPGTFVVIDIKMTLNMQKELQQSQLVYAIPVNDKEKAVPPVLPQPVIRKSGPQTAFIVKNDDPKQQGRVRIAFPWQAVGDPIIREELKEATNHRDACKKTADEDKATQEKLEHLLALLESRKKVLGRIQKELKAEPDQQKQKALFQKRIEENRSQQKAKQEKIKKIDEEFNEENPKSLAGKLAANLKKQKEVSWTDFITVGRMTARGIDQGVLLLEERSLRSKQEEQKDKKKKLESEIEFLKASDTDFIAYKESKAAPIDFLKQQDDSKNSEIKAQKKKIEEATKTANASKGVLDEAQGVVDKLTKKWEVRLQEVATPWVRVAMPMATEEGGLFFKPRPGDEVLVNFDNDNVERPYVVGSLYSKEHHDPQESMVIKSPSGQKISFDIAENDKAFMQSLTPMLTKLGSFIPAVGKNLTFGKDARKLCGGINFTDEFGMFSVNMSSTGRSVSVNSPFGNVSVNAFTGISISAPNGDISIRGKNVSIEAGNNLRLLSGANVTDSNSPEEPDDGPAASGEEEKEDKGWAGKSFKHHERTSTKLYRWSRAGGKFIGKTGMNLALGKAKDAVKGNTASFQIVDMQLLRCLCEVFLRPIEGTLMVKSKNYLMLEAGKGKTEVPIEQYSKKWQDFMGLERDADKAQFYAKVTGYIKRIDQKVGQFCQEYSNLRTENIKLQESFKVYLESFWKEGASSAPNPGKAGASNSKNEYKKCDENFKGGLVDYSGIKYSNLKGQEEGTHYIEGVNGEILTSIKDVKAYIAPVSESYCKSTWTLFRKVKQEMPKIFSKDTVEAINEATLGVKSHEGTAWIDEVFKKVVVEDSEGYLEKVSNDWASYYWEIIDKGQDNSFKIIESLERAPYKDPLLHPRRIKRTLVASFLLELYKSEGNLIKAEDGGVPKPGKFFQIGYSKVDEDLVRKHWADVEALAPKKNAGFFKRLLNLVSKVGSTVLLDWSGAKGAWKPMLNGDMPKMGWERRMWNGKGGKIIFSDAKNTSYTFEGEKIVGHKHIDLGNEGNLKKAISNIK